MILGVNGWRDQQAAQQCGSSNLGAAFMRVEFTIGELAVATQVADYCQAAGIRLQPLIGWDNGTPAPDLTSLGTWAAQLGPGGTHWGGASPVAAITDIELGNENSMYYKSGLPGDANYQNLATAYGQRALAAAQAINAANPAVGVLVELEGGDSNQSVWIDRVLAAGGTTLKNLMHGPVIHLYGPNWQTKLDLNRGFLANQGVTKPYFVTETGISTDNGRALSDNYGWPVNLTYAAAATDHQSVIEGMAAQPTKVASVSIFNNHDNAAPGASNDRENYFGVTTQAFGNKGAVTSYFRTAFATYRGGPSTTTYPGAGSAVSGTRASANGTAGSQAAAWNGLIFVGGYSWSSLTDWTNSHPDGWIVDPGQAFAYEAHHYWDTATAPSLGSRSGQYQQPAGTGVSTLTYATELAAAVAQTAGSGVARSGSVAVAGGSVSSGAVAGAVSGSVAQAATSANYTAAPTSAVSGTRATGAATSENLPVGNAVSGSQAALAPSVLISEPTRTITASLATLDGSTTTSVFSAVRSGTLATLLSPGQVPASAGEVVSATLATVAEQRETFAALTAVSGTRSVSAEVRQTWTDPTERRSATVGPGPIYTDTTAGANAASFTAPTTYLGPGGWPVGRLTRTPGTAIGWGAILAADITGTSIPAGTEVAVSWWARGTGISQDGLFVASDAFDSVAGQVTLTQGAGVATDPSAWRFYTGTTTFGASGWVPGVHRLRANLGDPDTNWLEWSEVLVTVGATTVTYGLGTAPLGTAPLGSGYTVTTSATITTAVSGTRAVAGPNYTQPVAGTAISGTRTVTAGPVLGTTGTAVVRSGTRAELEAAWIGATMGAKARSGTLATVTEQLTAQAAGVAISGTQVLSLTPALAMRVTGTARSATIAFSAGTTEVSLAAVALVSGSRAIALGVQVAPAEGTAVSGTLVAGGITLGLQGPNLVAVVASLALATAAAPFHPVFVRPVGRVTPQVPNPRMTLLVVETTTGRKVAELPHLSLSWNSPLNGEGKCAATLPIEATLDSFSDQRIRDPRAAARAILSGPYRFSLVPCYGRAALMGGPLLPSNDIVGDRVAVGAVGMERMLAKRVLNRPTGTGLLSDPSRDIGIYATTVGWAIYSLLFEATTTYGGRYPTRTLPVTCLNPPESVGEESYVWESYDLNNVWKAIGELVGGANGPDIRLEPYLTDQSDGTYVYWDLQVGDPYLPVSGNVGPQGPTPWNFAAANDQLSYSIDPSGMASSYFATGDGQDRAKEIARADSNMLTSLGFPALEEVDSTSSSAKTLDPSEVQNRANALVAAHRSPTDKWSLKVPIDGSPDIGTVRRGDVARIEVRDLLYLDPGYHLRRITELSGDSGRTATLSCDLDDGLVGV